MNTHNELQEFLDEISAFKWLAEQAGAERPLLDEIEALKKLVETTGSEAWCQMPWRAQRRNDLVRLSLAALQAYRVHEASEGRV